MHRTAWRATPQVQAEKAKRLAELEERRLAREQAEKERKLRRTPTKTSSPDVTHEDKNARAAEARLSHRIAAMARCLARGLSIRTILYPEGAVALPGNPMHVARPSNAHVPMPRTSR